METSTNGTKPRAESELGRLHVITDFHLQQRLSHAELARLAIRGGADSIQFRQKHGGIRNMLIAAQHVQSVCEDASIPLLVDDRLDIALSVGAAGVHLGQQDFPIPEAREVLGPEVLIGATATDAAQAAEAHEAGADYIGFGPVFETSSKRNPKSVKGPEGLADACEAVPIPVLAIGGITHDRVRTVLEAGAHGVAVLSAVVTANNPERATARFRAAIDGAVREEG
jgi:thiamine-phosphate pyrophosphorylase